MLYSKSRTQEFDTRYWVTFRATQVTMEDYAHAYIHWSSGGRRIHFSQGR